MTLSSKDAYILINSRARDRFGDLQLVSQHHPCRNVNSSLSERRSEKLLPQQTSPIG